MSDNDKVLNLLREQFALFKRLGSTKGPIKTDGKVVAFKKIISDESDLVIKYIDAVLSGQTSDDAIIAARASLKSGGK